MQVYDVIVWNDDTVVTYRRTTDDSLGLPLLRKYFEEKCGYEVEVLERQEQLNKLQNSKRGESLRTYLGANYHADLSILRLPREHRRGREERTID